MPSFVPASASIHSVNQPRSGYIHDIVLHPSYCHSKFINPPKDLQNSTNAYNVGSLVKQRWQCPSRSIHRRKKKMMNDACMLSHYKSWCRCFVPARSCCCCLGKIFMSFQKSPTWWTLRGGTRVCCAMCISSAAESSPFSCADPDTSVKSTCPPLT